MVIIEPFAGRAGRSRGRASRRRRRRAPARRAGGRSCRPAAAPPRPAKSSSAGDREQRRAGRRPPSASASVGCGVGGRGRPRRPAGAAPVSPPRPVPPPVAPPVVPPAGARSVVLGPGRCRARRPGSGSAARCRPAEVAWPRWSTIVGDRLPIEPSRLLRSFASGGNGSWSRIVPERQLRERRLQRLEVDRRRSAPRRCSMALSPSRLESAWAACSVMPSCRERRRRVVGQARDRRRPGRRRRSPRDRCRTPGRRWSWCRTSASPLPTGRRAVAAGRRPVEVTPDIVIRPPSSRTSPSAAREVERDRAPSATDWLSATVAARRRPAPTSCAGSWQTSCRPGRRCRRSSSARETLRDVDEARPRPSTPEDVGEVVQQRDAGEPGSRPPASELSPESSPAPSPDVAVGGEADLARTRPVSRRSCASTVPGNGSLACSGSPEG